MADKTLDNIKEFYKSKYWKQSVMFNLKNPFIIIPAPSSELERKALSEVVREIEQETRRPMHVIIDSKLK